MKSHNHTVIRYFPLKPNKHCCQIISPSPPFINSLLSSRVKLRVNGLPAPAHREPVLAVSYQQS